MINGWVGKNYRGEMQTGTLGNRPTGGRIRPDLADKLLDPESYKGAKFAKNTDGEPQARVTIDGYHVTATNLKSGIVFDIEHPRQDTHTDKIIASPVADFKGVQQPTDGAILEVSPESGQINTFLKTYPNKTSPIQRRIPLQDTSVDTSKAKAIMDLIKEKTTAPAHKKSISVKGPGMTAKVGRPNFEVPV